MGAVDESLAEVELAALNQIISKSLQRLLKYAVADPTLEATKARRVRRIAIWRVGPRGAGAKNPQHTVENIARVAPGSSAAVFAKLRGG